jgi:RHS repeat-associated protein
LANLAVFPSFKRAATHTDSVGGNESRIGEYVMLWNPSNEVVQLDDMRLENGQNGTSVSFGAEDSLLPYQRLLVHWGVSASDSLFRLVSLIPDTVLDDPSLKRIWSTGLEMDDSWGEVRLVYEPASEEELIDVISYGEAIGLVAENSYFADTLLDSLEIREAMNSLARFAYNSQIGGSVWGNPVVSSGTLLGQMSPLPVAYVPNDFEHVKGEKVYEMKNHLGNVLLVTTDMKLGQEEGSADDTTDFYLPEVVAANDYYPFGMPMSGRTWQAGTYRYGFNGIENEGEWAGNGSVYFANLRLLDTRLGRWFSRDPLHSRFPAESPYIAMSNNPTRLVDPNGDSTFVRRLSDGRFEVFGGNLLGNHNGIFLKGQAGEIGEMIGYSATPESFYNSETSTWQGTIDPGDGTGSEFLNDELMNDSPGLFEYMMNATGGGMYDFKRRGQSEDDRSDYHYRGMPIMQLYNGQQIYASARDIGNIGAGLIAGLNGNSWWSSRIGFDALETKQRIESRSMIEVVARFVGGPLFYAGLWEQEISGTQYAQKMGWKIGHHIFRSNYERKQKSLPGNVPSNGNFSNDKLPESFIITQDDLD